MAITPVPTMTDTPSFPALADRADGTYNSKAFAFGTHMADKFNGELLAVAGSVLNNATEAASKAADAATAAAATAADRVQTAADRAKTGQDVIATGLEVARAAAEADRAQAASTQIGTAAAFTDSNPIVKGSADPTKRMRFEVDGLTTGTTRVLTVPNKDGTLAMTSDIFPDAQAGDIAYSARNLTTEGYLKADGSSYLQSSYPSLYAAVGRLVNGGKTWTPRTSATASTSRFLGAAFGAGVYVLVGYDNSSPANPQMQTSSDGISWTSRTSPLSNNGSNGIVFGGSRFVLVGSAGSYSYSSNGADWAVQSVMTGMSGQTINAVAYGGGMFVAVATGGKISTSNDGITWTARTSGTGSTITLAVYGGGVWVVAGQNGMILTSPDGITWTARTSVSSSDVVSLAYGSGFFVLISGSVVSTSLSGFTWTSRNVLEAFSSPLSSSLDTPYELVFVGGVFIGLGSRLAFSSVDGLNWSVSGVVSSAANGISALCASESLLVASGGSNFIYTSPIYRYSTGTEFAVPELPIYSGAIPYIKA